MAKKLSPRANNTNTNEPAGTTRQVALRQIVAEQLAQHLATSELLLDRCTEIANTFGTDKIGALNAAARLLRAQAELAESIGRFSGVEQRQRTIVERIQTHLPAELIPKKKSTTPGTLPQPVPLALPASENSPSQDLIEPPASEASAPMTD